MLSTGEIVLVLVALLIIFGASRLPALGSALGKGIFNFKRTVKGQGDIDVTPVKKEQTPPSGTPPTAT